MRPIKEPDLHHHIEARMLQRGISMYEIQKTLEEGWNADDAKEGTLGKTLVFQYNAAWEGKSFEEKEITVYYKLRDEKFVLLTAKARYGSQFQWKGKV